MTAKVGNVIIQYKYNNNSPNTMCLHWSGCWNACKRRASTDL